MNRTVQQQDFISAVIEAVQSGMQQHFCLRARAGTGKTSTLMELVDDYLAAFAAHEITLCAFNKAAADEMQAKLEKRGHTDWRSVKASTIHSLGFGLMKNLFRSTIDAKKVMKLINEKNNPFYSEYASSIARLVSFAKLEGFGFFPDTQIGDTSAWYRIADHYDINGFDDTSILDSVIVGAQNIYRASLDQTNVIDFDDMILFPLVKNIVVRYPRDLLIVDEAQDTGRARQALLRKFVKAKGTMIVVGDDSQSIYGFAGSQCDALDQLINGMSMKVLPLTICWRCPRSVILEAQKIVPDIEWAPDAQEGSVSYASELPEMLPTDALLCRNTAPLIEYAYALLRQGVACKVEGREIGSGLLRLVNRWKVTTIDAFLTRLSDYREREIQKAMAKGKDDKVEQINDKCETIVHICNVCIDRQQTSLADVRKFIEEMFSDDVAGVVTLCTYHRSKGREWPRVFLIEHKKRCPSPYAKQEWQKRQEQNLAYVAITRAAEALVYLN